MSGPPAVDAEGTPLPDQVIHEYDGIQEYDNQLPTWWLYTLYGAMVFAVGYWFTYHVFQGADLPMQAYRKEIAAAAEREGKSVVLTSPELVALSKDLTLVKDGEKLFSTTCAACHGPKAGGTIGPNLTDEFWIHGGAPTKIYGTIHDGVLAKGMPAWGAQLGNAQVQSVTAYVLTLRNTNVPGGKVPQGDRDDLATTAPKVD